MSYEHDGFYEWPYVGVSPNRDWLLNKIKELESRLDGLVEEAVKLSKEYTDEQLAGYQTQVEEIRAEFTGIVNQLGQDFINLRTSVNTSLLQMDLKIKALEDLIAAEVVAINHRTDLAIEQNNEYILSEVGQFLSQIKVLNYFTGEYVTVQEMFNYLCSLHATDAIDVSDLVSRQKDVDTLVALYMTMTQLAMNGKNIIPA